MRFIERNPFTRLTLYRVGEKNISKTYSQGCAFCGQFRSRKPYLYRYENHHDGGRIDVIKGRFCSKSCMQNYHF